MDIEDAVNEELSSGRMTVNDLEGIFKRLSTQKHLDQIMVKPEDLQPCVGNPKFPCPGPDNFRFRGFDDKHRCTMCHQLSMELVDKEVGEGSMTSQGSISRNTKKTPEELSRREAYIRGLVHNDKTRVHVQGGWSQDPMDLYPNRKVVSEGATLSEIAGGVGKPASAASTPGQRAESVMANIRSKYIRGS